MIDSRQLFAEFVRNGSETAFRELVERYLSLVYSVALRLVNGDRHLAEDIAQTVFVDLARLAPSLSRNVLLGGWLHRHTCFLAARTLRGERRRQSRERQVAEMNATPDHSAANLAQLAPVLDDAINQLGASDRAAIVARFFEQRDLRSVGAALGTTEEAARKRVNRALEKLHSLLGRRGIALSAAGLGSLLAAEAIAAVPAGLAATVSTGAIAGAAAGSGTALILLKFMSMTPLKIALVSALAGAVVVAAPFTVRRQAQSQLRNENESLRRQVAEFAQLSGENSRLSNELAQASRTSALATDEHAELLRLRGLVAGLRQETEELAHLRSDNQALRTQAAAASRAAAAPAANRQFSAVQMQNQCLNNLRQLDAAKQQYALERHLSATNSVVVENIQPYLRLPPNQTLPLCPAGGTYTLGRIDEMPTCSIPGHSLP